jgi:hypothetical protein
MELDIDSALEELQNKTDKDIERETAYKWSARASAAFILSLNAEDVTAKLNYFIWGEDLFHEAVEHAALYKDGGFLLNDLEFEIEKYRKKALEAIVL